MDTPILQFCRDYKIKLIHDAEIKKRIESRPDNLDRARSYKPVDYLKIQFKISNSHSSYAMKLDDEDLLYLYNKYEKFLNKEEDEQVKKFRAQYDIF